MKSVKRDKMFLNRTRSLFKMCVNEERKMENGKMEGIEHREKKSRGSKNNSSEEKSGSE